MAIMKTNTKSSSILRFTFQEIHDLAVADIMDLKKWSKEDAEVFYSSIRQWCSCNVYNTVWSHKARRLKAWTTYGLKHICERDLGKYVANDWIKAALCEEGFSVRKLDSYSDQPMYRESISAKDVFTNHINFVFKKP